MWMWSVVIIALFCQVSFAHNEAVLILARGGSKGIRLKNLSIVGGISLLARSILTARAAGFGDITVSTDHPLIALEALKYNAKVFKRSHATSTDWAPSLWGISEYLGTRPDIDIIILLQATSPFVKAKQLTLSVKKLSNPIPFDCIFSATRSYKLRWNLDKTDIYPINFKFNNRPRRQDWSGELLETGAFYICRKELVRKGYLQNNKIIPQPTNYKLAFTQKSNKSMLVKIDYTVEDFLYDKEHMDGWSYGLALDLLQQCLGLRSLYT